MFSYSFNRPLYIIFDFFLIITITKLISNFSLTSTRVLAPVAPASAYTTSTYFFPFGESIVFITVLEVKPIKIKPIKKYKYTIPAGKIDIAKDTILASNGFKKNNVITTQQNVYIKRNKICHLVSGPYAIKNMELINESGESKNKTIDIIMFLITLSLKQVVFLFIIVIITTILDIVAKINSYIIAPGNSIKYPVLNPTPNKNNISLTIGINTVSKNNTYIINLNFSILLITIISSKSVFQVSFDSLFQMFYELQSLNTFQLKQYL